MHAPEALDLSELLRDGGVLRHEDIAAGDKGRGVAPQPRVGAGENLHTAVRLARAFPVVDTPVKFVVYPWVATVTQGQIDSFEGVSIGNAHLVLVVQRHPRRERALVRQALPVAQILHRERRWPRLAMLSPLHVQHSASRGKWRGK
jgi:hypothetical protein